VGLIDDALGGSAHALARLATLVEANNERSIEILTRIYPKTGNARTIGITGPPGAGKSTLVNLLVVAFRQREQRVGVIAVDPSSPISGGAALGDRIRMLDRFDDAGVFIRSMASRGKLGGLSVTTPGVMHLLDAAGFDIVLVETVGIGQEEIDVSRYVDTTVLVQVPGLGDSIQAMKAGILEVADVYVVNKADLADASNTAKEIRAMLSLGLRLRDSSDWNAPVIKVSARDGTGIGDLVTAIEEHSQLLRATDEGTRRRKSAARQEIQDQVDAIVRSRVSSRHGASEQLIDEVADRSRSPYDAARCVLSNLSNDHDPA